MPGTVLKILQINDWFSLEHPGGGRDMSHPVPLWALGDMDGGGRASGRD